MPWKTTSLLPLETMRTRLRLPPPSSATAAPAAARMTKLLRAFALLMEKPLAGVGYVPADISITPPSLTVWMAASRVAAF